MSPHLSQVSSFNWQKMTMVEEEAMEGEEEEDEDRVFVPFGPEQKVLLKANSRSLQERHQSTQIQCKLGSSLEIQIQFDVVMMMTQSSSLLTGSSGLPRPLSLSAPDHVFTYFVSVCYVLTHLRSPKQRLTGDREPGPPSLNLHKLTKWLIFTVKRSSNCVVRLFLPLP